MGKQVSKGSKYSDVERTEAAIQYEITGSYRKTSKRTGIPDTTLRDWSKKEWWVEVGVIVRDENTQRMRSRYSKIVSKAQAQTLKMLPKATAQQASIVGAVAFDKMRLIDNKPTSITAQDNRALADVCIELSRRMRQIDVVSTQHKVNTSDNDDKLLITNDGRVSC